jgi:membrane associated rhomboid family serine protease
MAVPKRWQQSFSLGGRVPWAAGLLIIATFVLSLSAALGDHFGLPLFGFAALRAGEVWQGELWRLVTWPFFEPSPLGLIFGCLLLYWFGSDLARYWGSRYFLLVYGTLVLVVAVITCLVGRIHPFVGLFPYLGSWAMTEALIMIWGFLFPANVIRFWFVLPIRGAWIPWVTIAGTVIYAIYAGWMAFLPNFIAEGSVLVWFFRGSIVRVMKRPGAWLEMRGGDAKRRRPGAVVVDFVRPVEPPDRNEREPN